MENPKLPAISNIKEHVIEVHESNMNTINTTMLCTEQKQDITCKRLTSQLYYSSKGKFKSVIMSANGIQKKNNKTLMV